MRRRRYCDLMTLPDRTFAEIRDIRRALHRLPELSGEEFATAETIAGHLQTFAPDTILTGIGGTGVAAIFTGPGDGPTVLMRCELDGLPIEDLSGLEHRSTIAGKGHQCGHDGHMAILLATAFLLAEDRPPRGRVVLLFQPAEENGKGARAVISDPRFGTIAPDFALSLHNFPGHPRHSILAKSGFVTCASRGMRIALEGRTAHASAPETGVSPAAAMAELIGRLSAMSSSARLDEDFVLVTVVHAHLGEKAFGVSPGHAEVWATLRTLTDERMAQLVSRAEECARKVSTEHGLQLHIDYDDVFSASVNDSALTQMIRQSAGELGLSLSDPEEPMRFSEDFGEFGKICPSVMFFLGAGVDHPALHNPDYDFPDELIPTGASMFHHTAMRLLGGN